MIVFLKLLTQLYQYLLRLYPRSVQEEFTEEMLSDFSDLAMDASRRGISSLIVFCVQELFDFPINLLRLYWREGRMSRVFRLQPVNYGLRGALGYGIVFGLATLISEFVNLKLFVEDHSIIGNLQVFFFDLFHTEHGLELIGWLPNAIASLLTGLVLGILFALLFADRSKYKRYIVAGMLGWFLHDAVTSILWSSANLGFFLATRHIIYFSRTELFLSSAFLGLTFIVAKSEKTEPVRWLVMGSFAYPLLAYFYIHLLFKLSIIETPWMFIALMILMVVYLASVFMIASKSGLGRKAIWMMVVGTLLYQLLPYILHDLFIWLSLLIPPPVFPPAGIPADSPAAWQLYSRVALDQSIYGMIFGLSMGCIFGLLNKRNPQQQMAT
jgi:hypothetical protein